MQITNEILLAFLHCTYKAFRKRNFELGEISDFEKLTIELEHSTKLLFEDILLKEKKLIKTQTSSSSFRFTNGVIINYKASNTTTEINIGGIEIIGKNKIIPILITPFEKISRTDKLFISLQASYLTTEFDFQIENCKIVYGKNLKQYKFLLTSFSKEIKKKIHELNKILIQSNPPVYYRNNHCQICEFQNSCLEKLKERDDLSLLTGLKQKEVLQKNNRGIFSVKQLSYSFKSKKNQYRKRKFLPELKALAIREDKIFLFELPVFKKYETDVFLDFEGIPDRNYIYLIGVILKTNEIETYYSFWSNNENQQIDIFNSLINLLKPLNSFIIYHYGIYEIQVLKRISKHLSTEQQEFLKTMIDNSFNVLNIFSYDIYPPTYSNGLKEIAQFLNFKWTEDNASGLQSLIWRYKWEITQKKDLKNKLLTYNIEDCKALIKIKDWVSTIPSLNNDKFENADKFEKETVNKWGKANFIIKELEQINHFAYFNYQREKVLIKTYPKIGVKKQISNKSLVKLYPNKIIELKRPKICDSCKCNKFYRHDIQNRTVVDLKITKTGIRRFIILYKNARYKCVNCKKVVMPRDEFNIKSKYGKNLTYWIINQIIHYRISYNSISKQLKESFDINFSPTQILYTKSQFARYYNSTFDEIINFIMNSALIHIDETIFHIRNESCYIWVFTNIDAVYYIFKPTREAEFLKEMLEDFKGVLISDFYAGYDAVNCPKQRCLIHLIRDLNDDLLKNQLDEELKTIVLNFSRLLTEITNTINKFGLKKRYLRKHKKSVEIFFNSLIKIDFESEICLKWQTRFKSYRNELFTFLDYNGIPWNNNNAENAIKAVALYRREYDGLPTKNGIQEYLTLLSIQQTCKFRGVNFLDFLKSESLSILNFEK